MLANTRSKRKDKTNKENKNEENLTLGAGVIVPVGPLKVRADYGYANFDHLSDPKRFSIGFSL